MLVLNLGNIVTSLFAGALTDRFGSKRVCITALLLSVLSFGLLSIKLPLLLIYLLFALAGVGSFGAQILLNAYVARYYPLNSRATAVGWSLGVGRLGGIVAPIFLGLLATWQVDFQWNFYTFMLASALGATMLFFVNDRYSAEIASSASVAAVATLVPLPE